MPEIFDIKKSLALVGLHIQRLNLVLAADRRWQQGQPDPIWVKRGKDGKFAGDGGSVSEPEQDARDMQRIQDDYEDDGMSEYGQADREVLADEAASFNSKTTQGLKQLIDPNSLKDLAKQVIDPLLRDFDTDLSSLADQVEDSFDESGAEIRSEVKAILEKTAPARMGEAENQGEINQSLAAAAVAGGLLVALTVTGKQPAKNLQKLRELYLSEIDKIVALSARVERIEAALKSGGLVEADSFLGRAARGLKAEAKRKEAAAVALQGEAARLIAKHGADASALERLETEAEEVVTSSQRHIAEARLRNEPRFDEVLLSTLDRMTRDGEFVKQGLEQIELTLEELKNVTSWNPDSRKAMRKLKAYFDKPAIRSIEDDFPGAENLGETIRGIEMRSGSEISEALKTLNDAKKRVPDVLREVSEMPSQDRKSFAADAIFTYDQYFEEVKQEATGYMVGALNQALGKVPKSSKIPVETAKQLLDDEKYPDFVELMADYEEFWKSFERRPIGRVNMPPDPSPVRMEGIDFTDFKSTKGEKDWANDIDWLELIRKEAPDPQEFQESLDAATIDLANEKKRLLLRIRDTIAARRKILQAEASKDLVAQQVEDIGTAIESAHAKAEAFYLEPLLQQIEKRQKKARTLLRKVSKQAKGLKPEQVEQISDDGFYYAQGERFVQSSREFAKASLATLMAASMFSAVRLSLKGSTPTDQSVAK